jgi:hypothetical protein
MKKIIIALFALVASYGSLSAQTNGTVNSRGEKEVDVVASDATGWHKIGEMTASFSKERDVMTVIGADRFAAIKIKAVDADINISDLEVYYENGTTEKLNVRSEIKKGGESRVIDLKGKERSIKKITFVYKTLPNSTATKAALVVWGLKTNTTK